jgi:hypothetical protein
VLAYETIVYLALKKYLRKKRVDRGARNRRPAPKAENHSVPDTPESEDIDPDSDIDDQNAEDVMDIQELIDAESHRMREVPENYDTGQRLDAGEIEDTHIRGSNRKVRQPSRFANAVMVGLRIGKLYHTDPIWDTLSHTKHCHNFGKSCWNSKRRLQIFSRDQSLPR